MFLDTDSKYVLDKWKGEEKQHKFLIYDYLDYVTSLLDNDIHVGCSQEGSLDLFSTLGNHDEGSSYIFPPLWDYYFIMMSTYHYSPMWFWVSQRVISEK